MWWKAALVALLVLPPISYVAGTLYAPLEAPDQRPALVLDDGAPSSAPVEPRVTLEPRPQPPRTPAPAGDDDSDDVVDDGDGSDDSDDSGVTIVRPVPQVAGGDDDDGDDDDRDDGDDDGDDDRHDERGDE